MRDYRTSDGSNLLNKVKENKELLNKKIEYEHNRVKNKYNQISNSAGHYLKEFSEIYNNACAYCGIPSWLIGADGFEIDHFICESSFPDSADGRNEAGRIENLVYACRMRNRGKGKFLIPEECRTLLMPDDNSISQVFFREDDYYIKINEKYINNHIILNFYNLLHLGSELKRLDYLLMKLRSLIRVVKEDEKNKIPYENIICLKLQECYLELHDKRNLEFHSLARDCMQL